jgi:phosphatidylglycerophosphate synthase
MPKRVSHSLLDPVLFPLVPPLYRLLHIPRRFPPEGIVISGHVIAVVGAVGFAYCTHVWWGGLLIVLGVGGNHMCDMVDGTHARTTNQCRNGGELLDHFVDPLSFSYWVVGLAIAVGNLYMGLAGVIILYATAVLTSIRAKLVGRFTLARFGPTEMKAVFVLFGLTMAILTAAPGSASGGAPGDAPHTAALAFFWVMLAIGLVQLVVNLVRGVREVNREGEAPDTSPWELKGRDTPGS